MIKMSRRALSRCILSILLTVYLVTAVSMTRTGAASLPPEGLSIVINDSLDTHFVSAADVDAALGNLSAAIDTTPRRRLNTLHIEQRLMASDRISSARCVILSNGIISIEVTPMIPVARVFPDHGDSYYVSATGKRITASRLHPIDVPVVSGHISSSGDVLPLLPMFDKIASDPELTAWVSSVTIDATGDIIIIPAVTGHTVNMGDTSDIDDKFSRIRQFYAKVMPVKGWQYYDNLSVKWRGRVVATRRDKKTQDNRPLTELDGIVDEILDDDVMLSSPGSAPQAAPDQQTHTSTQSHT